MTRRSHYDVVIIGAGKAGLTLARHLLLETDKTVLLIDKRADLPGSSQKVGESLVQTSGFYLCKVLDLQEHLLVEHFLKYNLRFHWRSEASENRNMEDYCCSFIRLSSNIPTFQVDRNLLERHLLDCNAANPRYELAAGVRDLAVELNPAGDHTVRIAGQAVTCEWVVDTSGRAGFLKKRLSLEQQNVIRHGSTWCWVDGLVDIERLTGRSRGEVVFDRSRRKTGHTPFFLATNHFCDEGMWFWIIPLHGKTSLGLVYDHRVLKPEEVSTGRKMLDYVARKWPVFEQDFASRKIVDEGRYLDFSYDSRTTISPDRWALCGEAGRFSDPLYSPGGDLIAIYNTLIVDAIQGRDRERLAAKCALYEQIMRVVYESYVPSYSVSYNCLGDQECFTLKYTWELAVYFGFYVVPAINNLFVDTKFMPFHMRKYGLLGPINKNLQMLLSSFFEWKKANGRLGSEKRTLVDFYQMRPLRESETLFYEVGLTQEEAEMVLEKHVDRLKEFARWIIAHVHAVVLDDPAVLRNASFVRSLKLRETVFDPEKMRAAYAPHAGCSEIHAWTLDPFALEPFLSRRLAAVEATI
jgi:flavin-dependent dehydrogenase